jgi:hypothetical protein
MDYTQLAAAGLNTLGQVAAQSMALSEDKHAMKRQFGYQMEMAKWQNDVNRENWQLQNEYNSPAAQMARLQEAGLNPNLVYNGGSATTAAGSMAPAANPGTPNIPDYVKYAHGFASSMSGLLDQALKAANIEKVAQETDNLKTYQRSMVTDIQHKELLNIFQNYANSKTQAEAEIWADLLDERLIGMRANNFLTDSKRFLTDVQKEYIKGPQTANTESSTARNVGEVALMQYRKQVMFAQIQDALASAGLKRVQADKVTYEIANLVADYQLKGATLTSKQLENDLTEILKSTGLNLRGGGQLQPLLNFVYGLFQQYPRAKKEVNEFVNPF